MNSELGMRDAERNKDVREQRLEGENRNTVKGDRGAEFSNHSAQKLIRLTDKGRLMARIPLDPRLSRMMIEAQQERCMAETVIIAAALSIQDPRERPIEKAGEADRMHAGFDDPDSDFVTLLNIWNRYQAQRQKMKSNNQMKKFCREHYLSFKRMREWRDIHSQILSILKEHGMGNGEGNAECGMAE